MARRYEDANAAYEQVVGNEHSRFVDGARFQLMKTREQIVVARYGRLEERSPTAAVAAIFTSPYGTEVIQYVIPSEVEAFLAAAHDLEETQIVDPDWIPIVEAVRPALAYICTAIQLSHGYTEQARVQFQSVIDRYPGTPEATYSAMTIAQYPRWEKDFLPVDGRQP